QIGLFANRVCLCPSIGDDVLVIPLPLALLEGAAGRVGPFHQRLRLRKRRNCRYSTRASSSSFVTLPILAAMVSPAAWEVAAVDFGTGYPASSIKISYGTRYRDASLCKFCGAGV